MLVEAIRRLRTRQPAWAEAVRFEITGKGESLAVDQPIIRFA